MNPLIVCQSDEETDALLDSQVLILSGVREM